MAYREQPKQYSDLVGFHIHLPGVSSLGLGSEGESVLNYQCLQCPFSLVLYQCRAGLLGYVFMGCMERENEACLQS